MISPLIGSPINLCGRYQSRRPRKSIRQFPRRYSRHLTEFPGFALQGMVQVAERFPRRFRELDGKADGLGPVRQSHARFPQSCHGQEPGISVHFTNRQDRSGRKSSFFEQGEPFIRRPGFEHSVQFALKCCQMRHPIGVCRKPRIFTKALGSEKFQEPQPIGLVRSPDIDPAVCSSERLVRCIERMRRSHGTPGSGRLQRRWLTASKYG